MSNNLSRAIPYRTSTDAAIAVLSSDAVFNANGNLSPIVADLPSLASMRGRTLRVCNMPGGDDASLEPNGAETIDGAGNYDLLSGWAILLYAPPTGTDWLILEIRAV